MNDTASKTEESRKSFMNRMHLALAQIDPDTLSYNESEFDLIRSSYEYVEFYAISRRLWNTCIALPLSRGLHNGTYRKSFMIKDGKKYKLPYLIHPLQVCRMLIDLQITLTAEEEDILLASALCHDMIEDLPFPNHGHELVDLYKLDPEVYKTVLAVSKRSDFTEDEEKAFFQNIAENKLALLVKLSDRGNNVEDLYNMSLWKVHEYAEETKRLIYPMCAYGRAHYEELLMTIQLLENKISSLIEAAVVLTDRYHEEEAVFERELASLREENARLRLEWGRLWNE